MSNRRFIAVNKSDQSRLEDEFPELLEIIENNQVDGYKKASITVFDHWLSEEEADAELNNIPPGIEKTYDARLHSFICSLTSRFETYLIRCVGKNKKEITFRRFSSEYAKNRTLTPQPWIASNHSRFMLVIPSLELAYFEGWDFTHHVYLKNTRTIAILKEEASKAGVYVL